MGTGGIISGILVVFLPETKDVHMPDTVQEIEDRAKAVQDKKNEKKLIKQMKKEKCGEGTAV